MPLTLGITELGQREEPFNVPILTWISGRVLWITGTLLRIVHNWGIGSPHRLWIRNTVSELSNRDGRIIHVLNLLINQISVVINNCYVGQVVTVGRFQRRDLEPDRRRDRFRGRTRLSGDSAAWPGEGVSALCAASRLMRGRSRVHNAWVTTVRIRPGINMVMVKSLRSRLSQTCR